MTAQIGLRIESVRSTHSMVRLSPVVTQRCWMFISSLSPYTFSWRVFLVSESVCLSVCLSACGDLFQAATNVRQPAITSIRNRPTKLYRHAVPVGYYFHGGVFSIAYLQQHCHRNNIWHFTVISSDRYMFLFYTNLVCFVVNNLHSTKNVR